MYKIILIMVTGFHGKKEEKGIFAITRTYMASRSHVMSEGMYDSFDLSSFRSHPATIIAISCSPSLPFHSSPKFSPLFINNCYSPTLPLSIMSF
ncbi:hypothetical protein L2E82_21874 [Cichorium intybus]|uniref:Uncharacterized protein n=1 Tax=Cichorium intybus TaxID=13427 RepID=A0ACB9DWU5_CICIN|nr:hypothetical protein L2E82_21874 [Cichorium intybus]